MVDTTSTPNVANYYVPIIVTQDYYRISVLRKYGRTSFGRMSAYIDLLIMINLRQTKYMELRMLMIMEQDSMIKAWQFMSVESIFKNILSYPHISLQV